MKSDWSQTAKMLQQVKQIVDSQNLGWCQPLKTNGDSLAVYMYLINTISVESSQGNYTILLDRLL